MGGAGLRQLHTSRGSRVASGEACRHWVRILALSLARWVALGASYLISPRPAGGLASALGELFGPQLPCGCGTWSLTFPSLPAVPPAAPRPLPYSVLWRLPRDHCLAHQLQVGLGQQTSSGCGLQ